MQKRMYMCLEQTLDLCTEHVQHVLHTCRQVASFAKKQKIADTSMLRSETTILLR